MQDTKTTKVSPFLFFVPFVVRCPPRRHEPLDHRVGTGVSVG